VPVSIFARSLLKPDEENQAEAVRVSATRNGADNRLASNLEVEMLVRRTVVGDNANTTMLFA
jgi:hypothetical protein